jgi:PelA/Pel-15E family pectate lyase
VRPRPFFFSFARHNDGNEENEMIRTTPSRRHVPFVLIGALFFAGFFAPARAQTFPTTARRPSLSPSRFTDQTDSWFQSDQGRRIVENIVTWQNANGGWWKNYDVSNPRPPQIENRADSGPRGDDDDVWHKVSTIDNNATYSEMRVLARAARVLKEDKYRDAFNRGLKFLLESQYPNGGWPQRLPLKQKGSTGYSRQITFNDDAMVNVMRLLKDIAGGKGDFAFVSEADRTRCLESFDNGVKCTLACQIKIDGKLTAWCQQHDAQTLAATNARAYELPSICSQESAAIVSLLMSLENPDAKIRDSVDAAIAWFESSKIVGKRYERVRKPGASKVSDVVFADDPTAPALWARFYDLETGQPFFCDRDGVKKASIFDIGKERRNGYAWYNTRANDVIAEYAQWRVRVASR